MYLQLWDTECQAKAQLVGHTERACDVAFHPQSGLGQSLSAVRVVRPVCMCCQCAPVLQTDCCDGTHTPQTNLASAGADCKALLWSMTSTKPIGTLSGHAARLARIAFHPSGERR